MANKFLDCLSSNIGIVSRTYITSDQQHNNPASIGMDRGWRRHKRSEAKLTNRYLLARWAAPDEKIKFIGILLDPRHHGSHDVCFSAPILNE